MNSYENNIHSFFIFCIFIEAALEKFTPIPLYSKIEN